MKIRPATADDVLELITLERASPAAAHWAEQQYRDLFQNSNSVSERLTLVAAQDLGESLPDILGFLVARRIASDWELENIVVAHRIQRKGVGRRLLEALRNRIRETESECLFLEVRESNASARAFYERLGFRQTGRRRHYYGNPPEDAILYRWP